MKLKTFLGWGPLFVLPVATALALPAGIPDWILMWSLALAIYAALKWLTWFYTPAPNASIGQHIGYLFAWPGMDARAFLSSKSDPELRQPPWTEWAFAAFKFSVGVWLLFGIAPRVPDSYPYVVGWLGMIGTVMTLHFGSFHLLSCAWRTIGVNAQPLMRWPLTSPSVSEYWGRRWNTAFRDTMHRFLFQPLATRIGVKYAAIIGFAISGMIHDVVMSVPARGGYLGPTLFFLVQPFAMMFERSRRGRQLGLGRGNRGRLFTAAAILIPTCLLLHRPFVLRIVVPFVRALGAVG